MADSATVKRIKKMLDMEELEPEKDAAGVYRPQGIEAGVRKRTMKDCIRWIEEEEKADGNGI